jgi:hypothetical protein
MKGLQRDIAKGFTKKNPFNDYINVAKRRREKLNILTVMAAEEELR